MASNPTTALGQLKTTGKHVLSKLQQQTSNADIIDIRHVAVEINLKTEITSMFRPKNGPRQLPTLLLYNERGLQLFERITYLEEYYLTNDEIEILTKHAAEMSEFIPSGAMVIELGSGNLRKVNLLLQALDNAGKEIDYYALDLSREELERTLAQVPSYKHVKCHGLLGTYDDGRDWLKATENTSRQKCILHLGSSIGNFNRSDAAAFLKGFSDVLGPNDKMLIGVDACNDPARVYHAYNDKEGTTHEFILNGLRNANEILGETAFIEGDWRVIGEYVYDEEGGRHQAFYAPIRDTMVMGELIRSHDRIQVEQSVKYSKEESERLWSKAGLEQVTEWTYGNEYGLHLLAKSRMAFSLIPSVYARTALPTLDDWEALWAAWDIVTRQMLPQEELLEKPIKLRNACIFYLGHIPTFLDIQLTKTTKQAPSEPAYFYKIFERGIDPDVDNPELCHAHSEIPDEWPPVEEILTYQETVRSRLRGLYAGGIENIPRNVGRAIWVGFEHELMHIETLLYMMLQSDKTLPPTHIPRPDFEKLARKAESERVPSQWFEIPAQEITIGLDDPEDGTDVNTHYGWDNEKPVRRVQVAAFQAQGRPITNEEYARYMYSKNIDKLPASWARLDENVTNGTNGVNDHSNGTSKIPSSFLEKTAVRTVYGLVPLKLALDWPVFASYDELVGCAAYMGGRIPTFEETRSIYAYAEALKKKKKEEAERQLGRTVPAVNAHLTNNGVEITPPSSPSSENPSEAPTSQQEAESEPAAPTTEDLFVDLDKANVGFYNWHPMPITSKSDTLLGQGELGGVWEWTSSVLRKWEGFQPIELYPGYTADFFDEKHNIVLGGSWATHPRIAGRKSFVNWYQRNYPYAWVGARVVRDM
ncbi:C-type lectin protein [Pseudoneurospora amorphoporcata]|uniref:C-type lectin protein n=1 Tax=Pseudoneurospora amorphoporcata TaxID=241081 RepID=A0AAN6P4H9_9PEZI|nr:C-type lectin protein [Pseudoneurospora amorphoporcata]